MKIILKSNFKHNMLTVIRYPRRQIRRCPTLLSKTELVGEKLEIWYRKRQGVRCKSVLLLLSRVHRKSTSDLDAVSEDWCTTSNRHPVLGTCFTEPTFGLFLFLSSILPLLFLFSPCFFFISPKWTEKSGSLLERTSTHFQANMALLQQAPKAPDHPRS